MVYYNQTIRNFGDEHNSYSNGITITGDKKGQRTLNVGLEQTVLINIVAAVNDDANDDTVSGFDTRDVDTSVVDSLLSSKLSVVSNLVSPRERTVSIPRSTLSPNMPSGTVGQKKPVYYKNSEFEVKKNKLMKIYGGSEGNGNRITHINRPSVKKQTLEKPKPVPVEKVVRKLPATAPILDQSSDNKGKHESVVKTHLTSWSPVRRLGALKKSNSRTLHETSKCDIIDIKLANDVIERSKSKTKEVNAQATRILEKHTKTISPPAASRPYPFYRSKSLPVVLPAKSNKSTRSPQRYISRIIKNTPVTRHRGKEPVAYGIIRHVATGFKIDELTISNSFRQNNSKVIAISREVRLHTPNTSTPRLSLKQRARWQSRRSLDNDSCSTATNTSTLYKTSSTATANKSTLYNDTNAVTTNKSTIDKDNTTVTTNNSTLYKDNCNTTVMSKVSSCTELQKQQTDTTVNDTTTSKSIEEAVKDALNGRTSVSEVVSGTENKDVYEGVPPTTHTRQNDKQTIGILNKASSLTDALSERKTGKHVQFAGRPASADSERSEHDTDRLSPNITGYGDSSMAQLKTYTARTFYPGIQPLTSQDLQRLKQKYIPTNIRNNMESHPSLNLTNNSAMNIQGLNRSTSELSGRTVSLSISDNEDNGSVGDIEGSLDDVDVSTSDSDEDDTDSDSDDDEEETAEEEIAIPDETNEHREKPPPKKKRAKYKFVKAVDLDSYTGFEHKKLRNVYKGPFVSKSSDDPLANFVKVKVRDVYL